MENKIKRKNLYENKSLTLNLNYHLINKKGNGKKLKRNYGLDLLRIFSMINILNLHINLRSSQLSMKSNSLKFKGIWRLEIFSYSSVNCFGLISGVVGYKQYNFANLIYLWMILCFYSVFYSIYLYLKNQITKEKLILSFFPILIKRQWYFNSYFSMYLFLPLINKGICYLNRKTYRNIIFLLIEFFSFYYIIAVLLGKGDYNFLNYGYSPLWLIILYIIGGYFGKYLIQNINKFKNYYFIYFLIYIFASFFTSEIYFILLILKKKNSSIFISYLSPTILLQAISLLMFFSRINIKSNILIKIISFFTPLTFSVLPIHCFLFTKKINIMIIFFRWIDTINFNMIFFKIYGLSIIFYFICTFIDYFRLKLFKLIKTKELILFLLKRI